MSTASILGTRPGGLIGPHHRSRREREGARTPEPEREGASTPGGQDAGDSTPGGQHTTERKHEKAPAQGAEASPLIETAGLAYR
ncbi:MAG: hypothetical protein ACPGVG_10980 [Mycobacterium sp.]